MLVCVCVQYWFHRFCIVIVKTPVIFLTNFPFECCFLYEFAGSFFLCSCGEINECITEIRLDRN